MRSGFVCAAAALSMAASLSATSSRAQSPAPRFDVVSVERNTGTGPMLMQNTPGMLRAQNMPIRQLIRQAYQLQDFQLVGAPDWVDRDRFDIEARFDASTPVPDMSPPQRFQAMLRALLADRFGMAARRETREMPIYALVRARSDGTLGPQMKQAAVDCAARAGGPAGAGRRGRGPGIDGRGGPGLDGRGQGADGRGGRAVNARGGLDPGAPFDAGAMPPCSSGGGFGRYRSSGAPLPMFVTMLSQMAGRTVVDRTGLTGSYDIDLQWSPTPDQLPPGPPPPGVQVPQIDPNGPSLFTALQEQLGLRLESTRGPVEVLVIEQIHRPTEN